MREILATIGAVLLLTVVPAVLILWVRDMIRSRRIAKSSLEREVDLKAWCLRMIHPKIEEIEGLCGGKIPQRLIAMYSDHDLTFSNDFEVCPPGKDPKKDSWWIGDFVPLTVQDQNLTCDLTEFGKGCCFAGDGMGNFYWVPVDVERKSDAPVYFACHDPWGNEKVTESLGEFLSWPRVAKAK